MKGVHYRVWLMVTLAVVAPNCFSQTQYRFEHYDSGNGLDSDYAMSMAQDRLGYIWIGYTGALNRFDGYNFKVFKGDSGDSSRSALNFNLGDLYTDALGAIWVTQHHHVPGSPYVLVKYDQKTDFFTKFSIDIQGSGVSRIGFDRNGKNIWLGTYGDGLYNFNTETHQINQYQNHHSDSAVQVARNWVRGISDHDSILILSTLQGLWQFDKKTKSFSRPVCNPADSLLLYNSNIHVIPNPHDNFLWLALKDEVLKVNEQLSVVQRFTFSEGDPGITYALSKEGVLWFPAREGIIRLNSKDSAQVKILRDPASPHSLLTNVVSRVFIDKDENLWLTSDRGVSKLPRQDLTFYNFDLDRIYSSGVFKSRNKDYVVVSRIGLADREHEVAMAPLSGDDLSTLKFQTLLKSIKGDAIECLVQGKRTFWLGNIANGAIGEPGVVGIPIDSASGELQTDSLITLNHDPGNDDMITSNSVITLWEDANMDLWLGQRNGGVDKVTFRVPYGKKGSVIHYPWMPPYFSPNDGNSFWTLEGTWTELVRIGRGSEGNVTVADTVRVNATTQFVFKNSDSTLVLGTTSGFHVGRPRGNSYQFEETPLWNKDELYGMQMDKLGRLWLRVSSGVVCYDLQEKIATEFKRKDGVEHAGDLNLGRLHVSRDGLMVMTGLHGLTLFDPNSFIIDREGTRPVITNMEVNNISVRTNQSQVDEGFSLPMDICLLNQLSLDYQHNNFSLEFSAMEMTSPEKNLYRHKLEGYDENWIETDWKNRRASYTNLPAGDYTFKVKATNHFGVWSDNERTLKVIILPPPWKTWWAYTGYALVVLGLLFMARRMIIQRERLKGSLKVAKVEQEKEHFELEKAKEVDRVKTSFFTNISHEFRTPLTLIKGPVESLLDRFKDDPDVVQRLKLVQRNSDVLLRLINQLLDLAKLEAGTMKIEKSNSDINSFIRVIAGSFESLARHKNVTLSVEISSERSQVIFDKDKLETILINLINNAIKFTPAGGSVVVRTELRILQVNNETHSTGTPLWRRGAGGEVVIIVRDTGIGIPVEHQQKIFERFHQVSEAHKEIGTGIGLSLVKELIQLLEGTITVSSEPGRGTTFTVMIPVDASTETTENIEEMAVPLSIDHAHSNNEFHAQPSHNGAPERPHVLVVEDNDDLRAFIIDSLGQEFCFLEADNGRTGLEIATTDIPDLIISDVMMPEMDGITMAGKIKTDHRSSHIPLILLTAKSTEDSKLMGLKSGADDYLTKPFNREELLLKVRNSISRQIKLREKLRAEVMSSAPAVEVMSEDERFLVNVKEKILERLSDEQLSVESLAEDIGISRVHLYRKVSGLTGLSVNELIRKLRLQRAAQLLGQNWGPVSQVAYEVGFSNLSYFSKTFKEEFGVLPSEYSYHG